MLWDLVLKFLLKQTQLCNRILISMLDFETIVFFIFEIMCMHALFNSVIVPHMHATLTVRTAVRPVWFTANCKLAVSGIIGPLIWVVGSCSTAFFSFWPPCSDNVCNCDDGCLFRAFTLCCGRSKGNVTGPIS